MKKLLLTLGSAAAAVAPMATVVACGSDDAAANTGSATVTGTTLAITGFEGPTFAADAKEEDMSAAMTTFQNEMGESLRTVLGLEKVVKVTMKGKLSTEDDPTKLEEVDLVVDFADVSGFANLGDLWDDFADVDAIEGVTGPGQVMAILFENASPANPDAGGDTDTVPTEVTAKIAAIGLLDVKTTEADTSNWDANSKAMDAAEAAGNLGIVADEFAKIEGLMDADYTFDILEFDATADALIVSFTYGGTSYDATLSGLLFTAP